jgi:hypothetical protein
MPQSGMWGTEVTIDGAHFNGASSSGKVLFDGDVGANGFVIESWYDNEIKGRIAFPATGALSVQTAAGKADAGTFTTTMTYRPSSALDVTELVEPVVLSTGDVAALYHQYELGNMATLAVFGGAAAGTYQLASLVDDPMAPVIAHIVEADDHSPEVIATKTDNGIVALTIAGGAVTSAATGLDGTVVAAGRDATGIYAWLDTTSGLVRARPGTKWTVDRGPFATPNPLLHGAIAADGTLWLAISESASGNRAYAGVQVLGPTDTQLGAVERVDPNSYPNQISRAHVMLAADGVHALVTATADASGTPMDLTPRLRTSPSAWGDAPAVTGLVQYAFVGTTLGAIANDPAAKTTSLIADVSAPASAQVIPVWPMQSEGAAVDATGKVHPLLGTGSVSYALTPP